MLVFRSDLKRLRRWQFCWICDRRYISYLTFATLPASISIQLQYFVTVDYFTRKQFNQSCDHVNKHVLVQFDSTEIFNLFVLAEVLLIRLLNSEQLAFYLIDTIADQVIISMYIFYRNSRRNVNVQQENYLNSWVIIIISFDTHSN